MLTKTVITAATSWVSSCCCFFFFCQEETTAGDNPADFDQRPEMRFHQTLFSSRGRGLVLTWLSGRNSSSSLISSTYSVSMKVQNIVQKLDMDLCVKHYVISRYSLCKNHYKKYLWKKINLRKMNKVNLLALDDKGI